MRTRCFSLALSKRPSPSLLEFEELSFKDTQAIFLIVVHLFVNLYDDLFGTRAAVNKVKMLSNRKADREGHSADPRADALPRILLVLRFKWRGEAQLGSVAKIPSSVFDGMDQKALNSCIVTADRGYGKEIFLIVLSSFGLASMSIIPDHILRAHPFVASSSPNPLKMTRKRCLWIRWEEWHTCCIMTPVGTTQPSEWWGRF